MLARLAGIQAALLSQLQRRDAGDRLRHRGAPRHRAGPRWLAAAQAHAPGRSLLRHLVALASSCDHARRGGLRHCLIGRLAGLPGHP